MAFGAELKDFVSGFQAGYKMVDSNEEKDWKRKEREMKQQEFQRTGEWHDDATAYRDKSYERQVSRDNVDDEHWDKSFGAQQEQQGWMRNRTDRQDDRNENERGRAQGRWEENQSLERDKIRLGAARETGATERMGDYLGGREGPTDDAAPTTAIPDGEDGDQSSLMNKSSYTTSEADGDRSSWLQYANYGVRNKPISPRLEAALEKVLPGMGIKARIFSGGQEASGPNRTGSHRHDNGGAADVLFYDQSGRKLDWANPKDRPIFQEIVARGKAAGITGFGAGDGYMKRGSMHLGFGAPAVWGRGGSGDTAPDWLREAYHGGRPRRGAIGAARGGMITALPEDDQPLTGPQEASGIFDHPEEQTAEVATALPEEGPRPTPRPQYDGAAASDEEAPTTDPFELGRRAVRDGMKQAIAKTGADQDGALNDPELEKMRLNYIRGYGAAPSQMMRQVLDKVDPDRKMPPAERNMKAMGTVYQFYMDQGETDKAKEAAASMIQFYRQSSQKFLALAQHAAENGDMDGAAKAAVAAYANIPNGRDMAIEKNDDGSFMVSVTDSRTGKKINQKVVSPKDIAATAMQFNPSTFDDEILNAAGAPAEEVKQATIEQRGELEGGVKASADERMADTGLNDNQKAAVADVAQSIAGIQNNGVGPDEALRFAQRLFSFDKDNPDSDKPNFSVKPMRGNPDLVVVTADGVSMKMTANAAAKLGGARTEMVKERGAAREETAKNKKFWTDQGDLLRKGVEAFKGSGSEAVQGMEKRATEQGNIEDAGKAIGAMGPKASNDSIGRVVPDEQPTAIPEPTKPDAVPPMADVKRTPAEVMERVGKLLRIRDGIMNNPNKDKYSANLREIEAELERLGHPVGQ